MEKLKTSHSSLEKQPETTFEGIDMTNSQAIKGDDSDGKVLWTTRSILAAIFLSGLYTGAQILLYFVGGSLAFIAAENNITTGIGWLSTANILANAASCPYAGYLQDLVGKRYIALVGAVCICIGCALVGSGHSYAQLIAGMAISGVGAAIGELTALAGLAEIVPVKHRGYSLAITTSFVLPFCPYLIYVEMWSHHDTKIGWRWGPWVSLLFNGIVAIGLLFTYFPHNHTRAAGFSRRKILRQIDYLGGVLSVTGLALFLVALQAGGYTHPWRSGYVLGTLLSGIGLIVGWIVWEARFAAYPMIPKELFRGQRVVALAYVVAFTAGMNFFSILNFAPIAFTNVYNPIPIRIGLRGLTSGLSVALGAIIFNAAISRYPSHAREVLLIAVVLMTTFTGGLAAMTPDNEGMALTFMTIAGLGVGGVLVPAATIAMLVCPDAIITTAAALSISIRQAGGSVGYSIYYNIFSTKLAARLPVYTAEAALKAGLPLNSTETFVKAFLTAPETLKTAAIPGLTPTVIAAASKASQWAYSQSLSYVWYTSIAFGSIAILCAIFLPNTAKYQTNRVAVSMS